MPASLCFVDSYRQFSRLLKVYCCTDILLKYSVCRVADHPLIWLRLVADDHCLSHVSYTAGLCRRRYTACSVDTHQMTA